MGLLEAYEYKKKKSVVLGLAAGSGGKEMREMMRIGMEGALSFCTSSAFLESLLAFVP